MKPLRLEMTAFECYAGTQVLDFRELEERDFFLIHGPTGGGKTTILDAITFALYGQASGEDRNPKNLRSHHARLDVPTEVTFDFALGARCFRAQRSPEQMRPAKRGSRTAIQRSKATLWELNSVEELSEQTILADRDSLVTQKIEELIGFKAHQFRKVVVLPQGDFKSLLLAKPQDREEIFERLFGTEFYRILQDRLKEEAKRLHNENEKLESSLLTALASAEVETPDELAESLREADEGLKKIKAELQIATQVVQEAEKLLREGEEADKKLKELDEARQEVERLKSVEGEHQRNLEKRKAGQRALQVVHLIDDRDVRRSSYEAALEEQKQHQETVDECKRQLEDLQAQTDEQEARETKLERANRAAEVLPLEEQRNDRLDDLNLEKGQLVKFEEDQQEADRIFTEAKITHEAEEARSCKRDQSYAEWQRLQSLVESARKVNDLREKITGVEEEFEQATSDLVALDGELIEMNDRLTQAEKKVQEYQLEVAGSKSAEADARQAEQRLNKRKQFTSNQSIVKKAEQALEDLESRLKDLLSQRKTERNALVNLQQKWREGQASRLAQELEEGEPCPVCGSEHHPSPAAHMEDLPEEEEIQEKEEALGQLEAELEQTREIRDQQNVEIERLKADSDALRDLLDEAADLDISVLEGALVEASEKAESARRASDNLTQAKEELKKWKNTVAENEEAAETVHKTVEQQREELNRLRGAYEETCNLVPEELREPDALEMAISEAKKVYQKMIDDYNHAQEQLSNASTEQKNCQTKVKESNRRIKELNRTLEEAEKRLKESLEAQGFEDETEYLEAKRDQDERRVLKQEIDTYLDQLKKAKGAIDKAEAALTQTTKETKQREKELNAAEQNLKSQLAKSGFADEDAYLAAIMKSDELEELDNLIQQYNDDKAAAEDRYRKAKQRAKGVEPPNLELLRDDNHEAQEKRDEIRDEQTRTEESRRHLNRYNIQVQGLLGKQKELERLFGIVGDLAEVTAGSNPRRINLHRFVLGVLLDQVLQDASIRLKQMSGGRYQMYPSEEVQSGSRTGGLGIMIHDHYTGESREASSLSGGETFLASLSLALGLVDVVQAHAGGISLDTIFIDEGFGTLDPEALDTALDVLYKLRQPGRLVGIISHVTELQRQITTRLEVTKTQQGSKACFVVD
ncbi:MAG: AAA family ATPase [Deltaproteobacteria bacterium]|nr:AAA family ATPase [Deltaproteobacteria bacterium]